MNPEKMHLRTGTQMIVNKTRAASPIIAAKAMVQTASNVAKLLGVLCLLTSCANLSPSPIDSLQVQQGQWESKVLIQKSTSSQKYVVKLSINAILNKKLRLDIISPLTGHLASLTLNGDHLEYLLPKENKYYSGPNVDEAIQKMLGIPLDPRLLYNLFFFKTIPRKSWLCQSGGKDFLQSCERLRDELTVTWKRSLTGFGNIFIKHPKASIFIKIKSFQPQIKTQKDLFRLKK